MKKVRILSLDGGGIRGIIPAIILEYVENKLIEITGNKHARIADYFDLVAGTSTGGILSCFYLAPNPNQGSDIPSSKYKASKALKFYSEKGYHIFNASKRNSWFGLRQLFNATQYNPAFLEGLFVKEFGEMKMKDLLKPCIVTTYDMEQKTSFFFSSRESHYKKRDFYVRDVLRSTSAAPTYFPPATITNLKTGVKMINIDGGMFANNPSVCAFAESSKSVFPQIEHPQASDMLILSIGTGAGQFVLPNIEKSDRWGVIGWAKSVPGMMMDGNIDSVNYEMKELFGKLDHPNQRNYKRIDVPVDQRNYALNMADASEENIKALKIAGKAALESALDETEQEYGLDRFIELLIENSPS